MDEPKIVGLAEVVIAVKEVNKAVDHFNELFDMAFPFGWELPDEKIRIRSENISGVQLQLIESTDPESVIAKFLKQKGEGLNHIAFIVTNLELMVERLKKRGSNLFPRKSYPLKTRRFPSEPEKANIYSFTRNRHSVSLSN